MSYNEDLRLQRESSLPFSAERAATDPAYRLRNGLATNYGDSGMMSSTGGDGKQWGESNANYLLRSTYKDADVKWAAKKKELDTERERLALANAMNGGQPNNVPSGEVYWSKDQKAFQKDPEAYYKKHRLLDSMNNTTAKKVNDGIALSDEKTNYSGQIADKLENISKSLISTNPTLALSYADKASKARDNAYKEQHQTALLKKQQVSEQNNIFSSIKDQDSLNEALPKLAAAGLHIPLDNKYAYFANTDTQKWIKSRAMQSEAYAQELDIQSKLDLHAQREEKTKLQQEKLKLEKAKRDSQVAKLKTVGKIDVSRKELDNNLVELEDVVDIASLSASHKDKAARDFSALVKTNVESGMNMLDAREEAKSLMQEGFVDGKYNRDVVRKKLNPNYKPAVESPKTSDSFIDSFLKMFSSDDDDEAPAAKPGPTAADLAYLKAHPEKKAAFEKRFGKSDIML